MHTMSACTYAVFGYRTAACGGVVNVILDVYC